MTTTAQPATMTPTGTPSAPRLSLQPILSRRTLLDGGWWPRSTDPTTELPQLILALNEGHSPVRRVILGPAGWDRHPLRTSVAGRAVRLVWFTSQAAGLLFALRSNGDRVDLLVVPPDTRPATARAAMALAAQPTNTVHAPDILTAVTAGQPPPTETVEETSWEAEGGHL
jgi:Family of unknown function (DUF5994)